MSAAPSSPLPAARPDSPVLEHALRRSLVERLRGAPGLRVPEAARALGVDATTVRHHARRLERAGHVVVVEQGRSRLLFLAGDRRARAPAPRVVRALAALRDGAATPTALAAALGLPRGTAGSLLVSLERAGLAVREDGAWRLTERAREHLAPADAAARGPFLCA